MEEGNQLTRWEGYVDWKNRPALRGRHGGMLAASFVLSELLFPFIINSKNRLI
ncbi:hypothetical protein SLEP1_g12247 [Rubroshorea leprosula]|uniref:Uncharacterized protein n=1 Tax=Rubroshorea leprosula TaxID=152421 RepID=A0AAV5ILQ9_9ROSI|nr:hypothetical protein SLEP1_g12247 [Rubroshorea leprosula]